MKLLSWALLLVITWNASSYRILGQLPAHRGLDMHHKHLLEPTKHYSSRDRSQSYLQLEKAGASEKEQSHRISIIVHRHCVSTLFALAFTCMAFTSPTYAAESSITLTDSSSSSSSTNTDTVSTYDKDLVEEMNSMRFKPSKLPSASERQRRSASSIALKNIDAALRKAERVEKDIQSAVLSEKKSTSTDESLLSPEERKTRYIDLCRKKMLVLKAYLDEAEKNVFSRNYDNLQYYLATFADQENTFVVLINGLFPNNDALDKSARKALSFEAQSLFIALEDLRKAARIEDFPLAEKR